MAKGDGFLKLEGPDQLELGTLLDRLAAIDRSDALRSGCTEAGEIVRDDAIPRITAPGYKGDKPGLKALSESILVIVREYPGAMVTFVGGKWPEGAHLHLVEFGHIALTKDGSAVHVPPHPALRPAAESTLSRQHDAIIGGLKAAVGDVRQ